MPSTTPLLLLLDSILSQDAERISEARSKIHHMIREVGLHVTESRVASATNDYNNGSPSVVPHYFNLANDLHQLLKGYPHLASVQSCHDGSLPLHFAASIGDVEVARVIMSSFPQAASTPNSKGKIPLHYAAREGKVNMVVFFLQVAPFTAQVKSKKHKLALHFAAGDGHIEVVRHLLRVYPMGASVVSKKGKLPLHFASRWGHLQIASDLLYVYPDAVRHADFEGSLPIHEAAREGQFEMSKMLVEMYPAGLSTENMRGETPLFAAVRSDNVDLVILYLQAYPQGGNILKTVSVDDNVEGWDPNILELCLRSAVGNFAECDLFNKKEPPVFFGMKRFQAARQTLLMEKSTSISCDKRDQISSSFPQNTCCICGNTTNTSSCEQQKSGYTSSSCDSSSSRPASLSPSRKRAFSDIDSVQRSKSPILEICDERSKKRHSLTKDDGKRRSSTGSEDKKIYPSNTITQRKYNPLHAALECGASPAVLRCVLKRGGPDQLKTKDELNRCPLHLAVGRKSYAAAGSCCSMEKEIKGESQFCRIILDEILKPFPQASTMRDIHGQLPLHLALAARASFCVINALINANPSSGVEPCPSSADCLDGKMPIYKAIEYGCDLSTMYLLLRLEPSVIRDWKPVM